MAVGQTTCSRNCSSLATVVKASPTTTKKNSAQAAVIQLHKKFSALNKILKFHHCIHSSPPLESILNQLSLRFRYSLFNNAVSSSHYAACSVRITSELKRTYKTGHHQISGKYLVYANKDQGKHQTTPQDGQSLGLDPNQ